MQIPLALRDALTPRTDVRFKNMPGECFDQLMDCMDWRETLVFSASARGVHDLAGWGGHMAWAQHLKRHYELKMIPDSGDSD